MTPVRKTMTDGWADENGLYAILWKSSRMLGRVRLADLNCFDTMHIGERDELGGVWIGKASSVERGKRMVERFVQEHS